MAVTCLISNSETAISAILLKGTGNEPLYPAIDMPVQCQYQCLTVVVGGICAGLAVSEIGAGSRCARSRPEQEKRARINASNVSIMLR